MRLTILDSGHSSLQKLFFGLIKLMMDGQVPGPILTLSYRRKFFGKNMASWVQSSLRNLNHWSIAEAEAIATFVSSKNQCQYCAENHAAVVKTTAKDQQLDEKILRNIQDIPLGSDLEMILPFLEKLTLRPEELKESDISKMLEKGISKKAVEEAVNICVTLNIMNRLADAFDFRMSKNKRKVAGFLSNFGYVAASIPG